LPPWRRLLSRLNWHPTIDKKVEQYRLEQRAIEFEKRRIAHEQRMRQLEKEDEQIAKEDARLAELDARIAALWPSSNSSSTQAPPPEGDSPV
jgi:membrane protein involved in colicin uptake